MRTLSILALSSLTLLACGAPDDMPPTEVGKSVWTPTVQTLIAENRGGGFVPPAPEGSKCQLGAAKYTLTVATRALAWTRCIGQGTTTPYMETSGSRTLSETEYQDLGRVLGNLRVVKGEACGADKQTEALTVITSGGQQEYGDSFYACTIKDRPLVESGALSATIQKLRVLSGG